MLPLVLKVLTDTSGAKLTPVTREMDGLRSSSQRAGAAIRNVATIFSDSADPVMALASSVQGLTRAFQLGLGATIAVVGITEAIKVFVGNADRMNKVTEGLNSSVSDFQRTIGLTDFEGAASQIDKLATALAKARQELPTTGGDGIIDSLFGKAGQGVADLLLAKEKSIFAVGQAETAKKQAQYAAETTLQKQNELDLLRQINPQEAKRLEIQTQFENKIEALRRSGSLTPGIQRGLTEARDIKIAGLSQEAGQGAINSYRSKLGQGAMATQPDSSNFDIARSGATMGAVSPSPFSELFSKVADELRAIKSSVVQIYDIAEKRLGVPILRSAS